MKHVLDYPFGRRVWRFIRNFGRDMDILYFGTEYYGPTALDRAVDGWLESPLITMFRPKVRDPKPRDLTPKA